MGIGYWPPSVPREVTVEAFVLAYETLGYRLYFTGSLEGKLEKIAIFAIRNLDGSVTPTHAALQLESGEWTSKLGKLQDIRHKSVDSVNGPLYGTVFCYMSRPRTKFTQS